MDSRDLGVRDEDVGLVEHDLHPLGVGHHVGRHVALVELHALDEVELQAEGLGLLDGDDAVLADLVHRLGDDLADGHVVVGRDRGDVGDLRLGLDVAGHRADGFDHALDGRVHAALQHGRVGAGCDVAQALADHGLGQDGRGGGAVTGDVVGLGGHLLDELGTHVLVGVLQLDLASDGDAVLGDGGGAPLLLEHDVAALGAEGHLDRVCELVDTSLEPATGVLVELDLLGHWYLPLSTSRPWRGCRGRTG